MKMYFQHSDGSQEYVCDTNDQCYMCDVLKDLHIRSPNYKTYYQRVWTDENGWIWVDVGSWSEYYLVKPD